MTFFQKHKLPLVLISILLGIAILLAAVLTTVLLVRESNAVLSFQGETIDQKMYSYLASTYKAEFFKSYGVTSASDNPVFFRKIHEPTQKSYGELFEEELNSYARALLVASYLYDRSVGLTKDDRTVIEERLKSLTGGDVKRFNEEVAELGFDYSALKKCAEMLYKAAKLKSILYTSGSSADTDACERFYEENYIHVTLLFIRTETVFLYDESGERLTDEETGYDAVRTLFESERTQRESDILSLREAIQNLKDGKDGFITPITMAEYLKTYYVDDSKERAESGYIFCDGESFTAEMKGVLPSVVLAAQQLEIGEFTEVVVTREDYGEDAEAGAFVGSCFIYRDTLPEGAYDSTDYAEMFTSFYSGVSTAAYLEELGELVGEVKEGKLLAELSVTDIPYTFLYTINF